MWCRRSIGMLHYEAESFQSGLQDSIRPRVAVRIVHRSAIALFFMTSLLCCVLVHDLAAPCAYFLTVQFKSVIPESGTGLSGNEDQWKISGIHLPKLQNLTNIKTPKP
jgi:hypothetical protein